MERQPKLRLKPIDKNDDESMRIYGMTGKTVESFNSYVADFFQTVAILRENIEKAHTTADQEKAAEMREHIEHVERKIDELTEAMQRIADDMSSLVEFEK